MKDRAKVVGEVGAGFLLRDLLAAPATPRLHLLGHSYGCQVTLAGVCSKAMNEAAARIESVLLFQPAVSASCFAKAVGSTGQEGRYRTALGRVRQPIRVIDLEGRELRVFRDPLPTLAGPAAYHMLRTFGPSDTVAPLAAPAAAVRVADLPP